MEKTYKMELTEKELTNLVGVRERSKPKSVRQKFYIVLLLLSMVLSAATYVVNQGMTPELLYGVVPYFLMLALIGMENKKMTGVIAQKVEEIKKQQGG
jgi:hypothetical protein